MPAATLQRDKLFYKLYFLFTALLLVSSVLGNRLISINSIAVICLSALCFIEGRLKEKFKCVKKEPIVIITAFYFLLYAAGVFISQNKHEALRLVKRESILIIVPLIFFFKKPFIKKDIFLLLKIFVYATFAFMCLATIIALKNYFINFNASVFFYDALVKPLISRAILASMLCIVSVAIIFFIPASTRWKLVMYFFFTAWLILLSSKMFLFIHVALSLINVMKIFSKRYKIIIALSIAALLVVLSLVNNPVKARFEDMRKFKLSYLTQQKFNPGIYFDGLSLRLIYERFALEILKENNGYLYGVGTGDAAELLKKKIQSYNMYTGNGVDGGYLDYSFHDVYMESLVSFGIIGLFTVLLLYDYIGFKAIKNKMGLLRDIFIIMVFSSFTDVIVIDEQFDTTLILSVCCLCIMLINGNQTADISYTKKAEQISLMPA